MTLESGTLPSGLAVNGTAINGTPAVSGSSSFEIQVSDSASDVVTQTVEIGVGLASPSSPCGNQDGFQVQAHPSDRLVEVRQ